jgi:hypothetical protein
MISLPIPDRQSPIRYSDINWNEYNMGELVSGLTNGRILGSFNAHLDPDINQNSLPRSEGWKPIFGQTGASQSHLRNNDMKGGDIFLFFGLFQQIIQNSGKLKWDKDSQPRHVLWGWMQVGEIVSVDSCDKEEYKWAGYHPHFNRNIDSNNIVYISEKNFTLPGIGMKMGSGAGVFTRFSGQLQLTAPSTGRSCLWSLPNWFYPRDGKTPLTYHSKLDRWEKSGQCTYLRAVSRGQEFILNCDEYPEAIPWVRDILTENS